MERSRLKRVSCVVRNLEVIKSGIQQKEVVKYVKEYIDEKLVLNPLPFEKKHLDSYLQTCLNDIPI